MTQYNNHIWNLITRILTGDASLTEEEEFNRWVEENRTNRVFFENLKAHWEEGADKDTVYNRFLFDHESGISKLRFKLREETERKKSHRNSLQITRSEKYTGWKAAVSILLVIGITFGWTSMHSGVPPVKSYSTSNMEQQVVKLPDGTKVRLNKNSKISFKKGFPNNSRTITLSGEAFFDVIHEADKPFIVYTENAVIRDIGTSFNINQQKDGKTVIAVKEGKVVLQSKDSDSKKASMLRKNQIGILSKGQISTVNQKNIQNYLSWIQDRLKFDNTRFDQAIRQLDNIYGVNSRLADSSLSRLKFTAYINDTSLKKVLDMISLSLDIDYRKNGNNIIWKKKQFRQQQKK